MQDQTPIGVTNWRDSQQLFSIKDNDRFSHIYAVGKTGVGKSTLLLNMAKADIEQGKGVCVIDPHGDLVEKLLACIPQQRMEEVMYFNPIDTAHPIGFNPLKSISPHLHTLVASGLITTFKKIWAESWGVRLEYILRFSILTLLEYPQATLLDIQPLLTNPAFRAYVLGFVKNHATRNFWYNEFNTYTPSHRMEAIAPILNKVGVFHSSTILCKIFGQQKQRFRIGHIMDTHKVLLINLSKGVIGEDISSLLGCMFITTIQLATLHRASQPAEKRTPFYLYVDEMHSFISLSFLDMLAEARKYKLGIFLTHQYIEQLPENIAKAILGNVGTLMAFRVGATDAGYLEKEFSPVFLKEDLINLPGHSMYLKLMIDGTSSSPFSAITIPFKSPTESFREVIIERSRQKYGSKDFVRDRKPFNSPKACLPKTTNLPFLPF
ncbi:type IV secretory system conjugative DNA transfer family protein [Emticicia sp. BO119]|uniref:type IV secretory system conjugative DNA transfer family protein n=1 Tax=Emticicia sp. BO119 TaxID=2757768 RepID=UPI0015F011F2|nr:type IV secretion system DNA-binding domain-containing protein [Emticicia sp. BO119]MBA4850478.1 type IV secretion system DNA-binding domain-containing protein [Emticicia sp. BO119]